MGIEIDFGRELGRLAFPDDVTDEQAQSYVRDNYQAIRQGLLTQRQEQLAAETQAEEAAKLRAGDIGTLETVGGQLYEAPRAAGRMLGQAAKGFARVFEAGAPDIEVTPEEQATILARSPITQAGEKLVTAAEELPVIPGVEKTIPGQVMGGVGSVAGLLPATLVGGPIAGGAVYGFSAGEEAAEDARRTINRRIAERLAIGDVAGADDLRAQLPQLEAAAFGITAPIGAVTEGALGLAGKIGRVGPGRPTIGGVGSKLAEAMIPKAASIRTQNMIRGGIEGAVTEGLQESLEQTMGNMAAKVTYDPERGVMDGVAQAGFIGAASGGFVGGTVGSRKNLAAANAVAEATGADPGNPLPRSTATVAGIQDGPQPTGPIEIEPEVTPEEVLRMSQELGIPVPPEMVTPTPAPVIPAPAAAAAAAAPVTPAPTPAPAAAVTPEPAAVVSPAAPGELEPDEQAELDALIEKEDAGTLTEDDSITLSAYRSRLGFPAQPPTPTPSAVQEQGPDEGVLRREEPQPPVQVELREVDQGGRPAEVGGAEAEVTPEEVQQVKAEVVPEVAPAAAPATPAVQSAKLPKDLAGAKPRYNVSMDAYLPTFGSDFDRAAFIVTQKTPSKRDADYLNWAVGVSGMTPEQVRQHGLKVRAQLKQLAAQTKGGTSQKPATLTVPSVSISMPEVKITAAPAPAPTPTPAAVPAPPPAPAPTTQVDPNEKLAAFIEDVDGAITNLESPAKLRAMVKKALAAGYITARDAAEIASVQKSMGSAEDTADAFGEFAGYLNMELEKRRKAPVVAPVTAPAAPAPATTTPAPAAKTANELAGDLALLRAQKPRPLSKLYGPNPTEKQKAAHKAAMSDWEKQYRKLAKLQQRTLEQEKANRAAKVREAAPGEPAQPPAAAATPMQEGIDNLKFVSEPVAKVRGGGMDPKDAKVKLVQQLERAVEAAPAESDREYNDLVQAGRTTPEEHFKSVNDKNMGAGYEAKYRERHELGKKLIAKYGPTVPRVTIEIPGDGTYTVANTKQALNQVLDKARKLNTSMAKGPVKAPAARQKAERPKEALMRMAKEAVQVYGKNAAAKLREQANNPDLDLTDEQRNELKVVADMLPDRVEALLQKVIAATDPKGKAFEAITALSSVVIYQATKIALRIYQSTKSWLAARNAGMDYIKSHVQLQNEAETGNNFEEYIKGFPNQEIPAGTPEPPQPPSPGERVESRGIFRGDVTRDTDENWQAEARKWVDFYKGNLEQAFQGFMGADIDKSLREYVGGELLQRSELEVARAKNPIDLLRALNLQARIANALVQAGSDFGKQGRARQLTFARYAWMVPQLVYRRLVNEQQKRKIPFPEIIATQVRDWLVESGQQAIDQVKEAMKQADNVFAREFRKVKQVPGETGGPPIEIKWSEILTKSLQTQGSVRQKMLQVILADPRLRNLSPAGIAEITNLLTTAWENKRNQIFRAEFKKKIPLPNVKPDAREKLFRSLPRILKYANIARATPGEQITTEGPETFLLWEQAFRDAVAPEFGVAEINGLTARKITELAQRAQAAEGTNRNEIIQQMFRLMAREGGVRFSDVLRDYWYAAVLSGTRTQLDNALNILNGALNTVMLAGMAGKEAGLVTKSALKGLDEGIRDFWPMLWRGELYRSINFNPDQPGNSLEGLGESRNLFAKGLSQAKYVSRLMLALDHVTAMMSDGAAKAYALQKEYTPEVARNLMLPDKASVQAARDRAVAEGTRPDLVNKRTREILQEKFPVDVLMTSKDIREAVTFTEVPQGVMGSLYEGLNAASRKFPALKFLTGTNFVRFAANYTNELLNYAAPIAAYRWYQSAPGKSDQPGGLQYSPARRDILLAKAAIGTALGATAAALFLGDDDKEEDRDIDITGSFKSLDPNKRKQLLAEGRQPYSIRVGDTYISYRQLGFGGLLGAIGELRDRQLFEPEKWNQEGIIAKVQDAATAGLFIVKDSSAISGLTEFLGFANAYKYDTNEIIEKSAPRYLARLGGSFVPNILKEVDAWSDPSIFKAEPGGLGHEYFLQQVPFARREIGPGPILNVLGEPVRVERYPYSRWVTQRQDDPAWNTLGQLASRGVFMPTPAITVKVNENGTRREMTREEKYQYQRAVGQGYRKFIEQNSKRLLALPPAEAADFIDKNADRIRRNARTNLKNSF